MGSGAAVPGAADCLAALQAVDGGSGGAISRMRAVGDSGNLPSETDLRVGSITAAETGATTATTSATTVASATATATVSATDIATATARPAQLSRVIPDPGSPTSMIADVVAATTLVEGDTLSQSESHNQSPNQEQNQGQGQDQNATIDDNGEPPLHFGQIYEEAVEYTSSPLHTSRSRRRLEGQGLPIPPVALVHDGYDWTIRW